MKDENKAKIREALVSLLYCDFSWVRDIASEALALLDADGSDDSPADLEPALMRLKLISDAREKGIPWSAIGSALGMTGKEAKASAKRLAAYANRQLLAAQLEG